MRRTGALAGRGAGGIAVYLCILAIMRVPVVGCPAGLVGQERQRIGHVAPILPAELLAELCRADRADLHTLAAGHTLISVDMRTVCRPGHVRGVVQLRGADGVADAGGTVAETDDLVLAVDVRRLVHKAVALCPLTDLKCLLLGDVVPAARIHTPLCEIPETDAAFLFDRAIALPADPLLPAAGTDPDGELAVILLEPVGDVLDRDRRRRGLDRLFHGNDMHADAAAAHRHHGCDALKRHLCHQVEEGRDIRVLLHQPVVHHHEFGDARHKDRHVVPELLFRILPVRLDAADPHQVLQHFVDLLFRKRRVFFDELLMAVAGPCLLKAQHELHFVPAHDLVKAPDLRIIRLNRVRVLCHISVGDHTRQADQEFELLLVRIDKVLRQTVVTVVYHAVFLFLHLPLLCIRFVAGPASDAPVTRGPSSFYQVFFHALTASKSQPSQASMPSPVFAETGKIRMSGFSALARSAQAAMSKSKYGSASILEITSTSLV